MIFLEIFNIGGIYNFAPVLILPYGHPLATEKNISLSQISQYELIIPPPHFSTWTIVESVFDEHNIPYKVSLEAGSWEVIKKYVELGLGISIVTSACLTGNEKLITHPLPGFFLNRKLWRPSIKRKIAHRQRSSLY